MKPIDEKAMREDLKLPDGWFAAAQHAFDDYQACEFEALPEHKFPLKCGFASGALWMKWKLEGKTKYPNGDDLP